MSKRTPIIAEKAWDPNLEAEIRRKWLTEETYKFVPQEAGRNFVIDTPPPYPSGRPWHIGAAAHYSQIDMIARTARMSGKNVYFPIGIDRNGLPVELYTEKKHGIHMRDTDRSEFLEMCRASLDELESEMVEIMDGLGLSGDTVNRYRTDSEEYRTLTQATFIKMWHDGDVYVANRPNNYDWVSGTTIADAEITYVEMPSKLVHMKFGIEGKGDFITVASTRPELLCACKTVIVNPDDSRYAQHVGRNLIVPVTGAKVQLQTHNSAKAEFGSGAVMVCSYGDQNDVELFRELKLEEVTAIGLDGRMTAAAGAYAGLRPKQARVKIIEDMQTTGSITKIEEITHRTPISERSKNPIEIIPMEEYYLKQKDSVDKIREMSKKVRFHPPMHRQILMNWLESINMDWPISRRRYYGTEIPIWYCKKCRKEFVPEPGRYYRPWTQKCPADRCARCGSTEFVGEERTFDTWMDSSVSALYVSRFGRDDKFFEMTYPTSIRPQAKDIVRTWLYYTLLRCSRLTDRTPWSEAWIMGYGLDEHGMKMSKSKGNAIDPLPVIRRLGADTFRFWNASEVNHGYDFRCNEQKIESAKKFLTKLWNVSRFLSSFQVPDSSEHTPELGEADRWVLSELDALVSECKKGYDEYNFFVPAIAIREFTWNLFAAHYIEMVKGRAYGIGFSDAEREAAVYTLHRTLSTVLRLLAPIAPFITEHLWQKMYSPDGKSIHAERLPEPGECIDDAGDRGGVADHQRMTTLITEFNSAVWNEKKSKNLSLKDQIDTKIPEDLLGLKMDLESMHNIVQIADDVQGRTDPAGKSNHQ